MSEYRDAVGSAKERVVRVPRGGDEAFLVANQSLLVIDAKDGHIKKRLTAF